MGEVREASLCSVSEAREASLCPVSEAQVMLLSSVSAPSLAMLKMAGSCTFDVRDVARDAAARRLRVLVIRFFGNGLVTFGTPRTAAEQRTLRVEVISCRLAAPVLVLLYFCKTSSKLSGVWRSRRSKP